MKQSIYINFYKKIFFRLFLLCFLTITKQAICINNNDLQKFDTLAKEVERISFSNATKSQQIISILYQIAKQHKDSVLLYKKCLYYEAGLGFAQGVYDSTLTFRIQKELSQIDSSQYSGQPYALLNYSLSVSYLTNGRYAEAFTIALHTLEKFRQLNDSLMTGKTLLVLGRICNYIESYHMAEKYYCQARQYTRTTQLEYCQISSNIYNMWARIQRIEEAIDSLQALFPILEQKKDTGLLATTYLNLGVFYAIKKEHDKALQYYKKAEGFTKYIDNERFSISLYQNMGVYYANCKELILAYESFSHAKQLAERSGNANLIAMNLLALSQLFELFHNTDSAFFYLKEYQKTKGNISESINPMEAYQAYISVYLESSQKELTIKEQEVLLHQRRTVVIAISAIGILLFVIACMVILYQQKRHSHQQELLKEAENKELEEKLQIKQELQQLQEERIAMQSRELSTYSLALANKTDIIQQVSEAIQQLPKGSEVIGQIRQVIKSNLNTEKTWDDFVLHFEKVHPSFFNRIKSFCSELSENDLRLCAYFRIGLSTKQIAQILNVSPGAIKTHRYRMKKKLNLGEEQDLDDFIRNI